MDRTIDINWLSQKKEGEGHIKFGIGVGAFGAGSLALIGATCPLCFFVAPAMVGLGVIKRRQAMRGLAQSAECPSPVPTNNGEDGDLGA